LTKIETALLNPTEQIIRQNQRSWNVLINQG
jgi:hypothetical protein